MLNGFGYKVNRALIKVAENEQKIERESFRQQVITALASAQNAYWDLISAQGSVRAAEQAVAVANSCTGTTAGVRRRRDGPSGRGERAIASRRQPAGPDHRANQRPVRRADAEEHDQQEPG